MFKRKMKTMEIEKQFRIYFEHQKDFFYVKELILFLHRVLTKNISIQINI